MTILIMASSGTGEGHLHPEGHSEVYFAEDATEAEKFCERWNERELETARNYGGYPGDATVISVHDAQSAADWLAEDDEADAA